MRILPMKESEEWKNLGKEDSMKLFGQSLIHAKVAAMAYKSVRLLFREMND